MPLANQPEQDKASIVQRPLAHIRLANYMEIIL